MTFGTVCAGAAIFSRRAGLLRRTSAFSQTERRGHRIKVDKAHPADPQITEPLCSAGVGAPPPEDGGGVPGYADFARVTADPSYPELGHMGEWIGGGA